MPEPSSKHSKAVTDRAVKIIKAVIATHPKIRNQSLMAETLGVSKQTLSKWTSNEGYITIPHLVNICSRLKANPFYLLIGTGDMFLGGVTSIKKNDVEMTLVDLSVRIAELEVNLKKNKNGKEKR